MRKRGRCVKTKECGVRPAPLCNKPCRSPALVHCPIEPEENVYPMIPSGKSVLETIGLFTTTKHAKDTKIKAESTKIFAPFVCFEVVIAYEPEKKIT